MAIRTRPATTPAQEAQRLFFELGMVQRQRVGSALAELDLTFAQAHALRLLDPNEPRPMSVLAERLFCDASNVTGIADRLENRGLIERRAAAGDRRIRALVLTPKGVALRNRVREIMMEPSAAIAALSLSDQRALRDILERAVENLGNR